ncbi:hypothetical protein [Pseudomonas juntendi]|uniref:hypothetical protein n=1 Tax=Pseudomonas juntendi TaxID=2666183 RepID=UPI001F4612FD|nr:hypothetical protein [Pseudomonas juntendi]MCO7058282.1 hypothetical protein [Pseudomonas juntendi]UJM15254.1 hypothetical protein L1P09_25925 [Pseudomonas juntendi]
MISYLRRKFRPQQNPPAPSPFKKTAPAGRPSGSGSAPSSTAVGSSSSPDPITGNPLHPLNPLNPANQVYYVAPAPEPARYSSEAGAGRDSARLECAPGRDDSRDSGGWGGGSDYGSCSSSSDSSSPSSDY